MMNFKQQTLALLLFVFLASSCSHHKHSKTEDSILDAYIKASDKAYEAGHLGTSEALINDAVTLKKALYGDDNTILLPQMNQMAHIHNKQGQYQKLEEKLGKILKISKKKFGQNNPKVATIYVRLANLKMNQNSFGHAEQYIVKANHIFRQNRKKHALDLAENMTIMAQIKRKQGDTDNVEKLLLRAIKQLDDAGHTTSSQKKLRP